MFIELKKYFLLGTLIFLLFSCGKIKRENPHDPDGCNFQGPVVTITSPLGNGKIIGEVNLAGRAIDPQEGNIIDDSRFLWISDIDGKLFSGRTKYSPGVKHYNNLTTEGKHVVTLQVKDEDGNIGYAKVKFTFKSYGSL
ncbi:MAG: hypothetical protein QMD92_08375 [bacterium]|nr:hypothetical protein [bacterium]